MSRLPEPLLSEDTSRFTQLPLKYPSLQEAYKKHQAAFWVSEDIDYSSDYNDWLKLNDNEKFFIEHILAFFAGADGIVLENLVTKFCQEVKATEARNFYGFQGMMENIHGEVYALLIDTYIKDKKRKDELFNAIENIPCITKKANWAMKWICEDKPFEQRLIAFAIVEGIFFSGSFCAIFWLKNRGIMVKALGHSNELISRDEGLHTDFAVLMYKHLNNKVTKDVIEEIFKEAVEIEEEFICESLPCRLVGMNSDLMKDYIRFVADRLVVQLGFDKIYNTKNPFHFMENICLDGKTNFFEKKEPNYRLAASAKPNDEWKIDFNF